MLLDDVGSWLQSQAVGVFNLDDFTRNIFASMLTDTPDQAIAIYEYGGLEPVCVYDVTAGVNGAIIELPNFQVMTRGVPDDYQDARSLADLAYRAVLRMQAVTVNGTYYFRVIPKQAVTPVGRDDKRRPLFSFNCEVRRAIV